MPWTNSILRSFQMVPINPSEADFHGPYNKLLNILFPPDSQYTVVPHFMPGSRESADFLVLYEVLFENRPIFILELKPPGDLRYGSKRQDADLQIRRRIIDLRPDCPLPVLHAISAFGTQLCFYSMHRNQPIEPPLIPAHEELLTDTAPRERWNSGVLEDEGEQRFRGVVEEIMHACANA